MSGPESVPSFMAPTSFCRNRKRCTIISVSPYNRRTFCPAGIVRVPICLRCGFDLLPSHLLVTGKTIKYVAQEYASHIVVVPTTYFSARLRRRANFDPSTARAHPQIPVLRVGTTRFSYCTCTTASTTVSAARRPEHGARREADSSICWRGGFCPFASGRNRVCGVVQLDNT